MTITPYSMICWHWIDEWLLFIMRYFFSMDFHFTISSQVFIVNNFDAIVVAMPISLVFGIWSISMLISTRMTPIKKALSCKRLLTFHYFFRCAVCCWWWCWCWCRFFIMIFYTIFYKNVFISFDSTTGCSPFSRTIQWKWNNSHRIVFVLGSLMPFATSFVLVYSFLYKIYQFNYFEMKN